MMDLKEFMKKVDVTKPRYVQRWIDCDLIPGIIKGDTLDKTQFPDSARRPYFSHALKPNLSADKIRAHIVKACIERKHITKETCFASSGEFNGFICDLENAGLIHRRIEDGITYFDSTSKSDMCQKKNLNAIKDFILDAIKASSEGLGKGAVSILIDKSLAG